MATYGIKVFMIQRILQKSTVFIFVIALICAPKLIMGESGESIQNKYAKDYTQISKVKSFKKATPAKKAPSSQQQMQQTSGPPYRITTGTFTVTGKGSEGLELPFSPKRITTGTFTVTGKGSEGLELPFSPKRITTETFTVTGKGETH